MNYDELISNNETPFVNNCNKGLRLELINALLFNL